MFGVIIPQKVELVRARINTNLVVTPSRRHLAVRYRVYIRLDTKQFDDDTGAQKWCLNCDKSVNCDNGLIVINSLILACLIVVNFEIAGLKSRFRYKVMI